MTVLTVVRALLGAPFVDFCLILIVAAVLVVAIVERKHRS